MNRLEELKTRLEYLRNELKREAGSLTAQLLLEPSIERLELRIATLEATMSKKRMRRKPARAFSEIGLKFISTNETSV